MIEETDRGNEEGITKRNENENEEEDIPEIETEGKEEEPGMEDTLREAPREGGTLSLKLQEDLQFRIRG